MGRRNRERVKAIRFGNATPIKLQRQLDTVEELADEYGGQLVAEGIAKMQAEGQLKPIWGKGVSHELHRSLRELPADSLPALPVDILRHLLAQFAMPQLRAVYLCLTALSFQSPSPAPPMTPSARRRRGRGCRCPPTFGWRLWRNATRSLRLPA